jgi:hypothetical protein
MNTLRNNLSDRINLRGFGMLGTAAVLFLSAGVPATSVAEQIRTFCQYGSAGALQFGAGGAVWSQQWGQPHWDWFDCDAKPNASFLNENVVGLQTTTTTGAPVIDANLILSLPFAGTIRLVARGHNNTAHVDGTIIGDMTGSFVADLNAAHAVVTDETITIQFGQSVHSAPDALIQVTQTTGKFKSIHAVGDWEWHVQGTVTIARVPSLSPQMNIFAALQNSALLLGAEEQVVLSGSYTRSDSKLSPESGEKRRDLPLKAKMEGVLIPPSTEVPRFTAHTMGTGTLMGRFIQELTFDALDFTTGAGHGTYVQTAANGDTIQGTFTVQFLNESDFLGSFTVDEGTGRFEGATGFGASAGRLNPDLTFGYAYDGTITLAGGAKP